MRTTGKLLPLASVGYAFCVRLVRFLRCDRPSLNRRLGLSCETWETFSPENQYLYRLSTMSRDYPQIQASEAREFLRLYTEVFRDLLDAKYPTSKEEFPLYKGEAAMTSMLNGGRGICSGIHLFD
jgi:hypothetical protein